ncbi:Lon protease family protein [Alteromonas oceanisediminis]|uniref:Lon protease family protein n=1 Tax=Alteromonas oceanisediminis TaxID=2836180 RepID=UPI001BDB07F9|nr:ATP-binding protein [Alteromonas oceanisediminis]MBT0586525.1 Lon protease family protein [Alteromonas oceanisediminis]
MTDYILSPEQLCALPDRKVIRAALEDDAALQATFIGQDRAREALSFGLGIQATGYNLYVMGEQATGRYTLVHDHVAKAVVDKPTPDDWLYLNNFSEEREPIALRLPPGDSKQFYADIDDLIDQVQDTFPAAFENPGYQRKKAAIGRQFELKYDHAIDAIESQAQAKGVAMIEDDGSITFSPIINGTPVTDQAFAHVDEPTRQQFYALIDDLETQLSEALIELPIWKRQHSERVRELTRATAEQGIKPLLKSLEHKYAANLGILKYLRSMRSPLIDTVLDILAFEGKEDKPDDADLRAMFEEQFLPNTLVSHGLTDGVPVVYEPNPTHQHLFGKIEYSSAQGVAYTTYQMIRSGALHRANGGYLLLDADKLVEQPYVWESLKLALKFSSLKMDLPQQDVGMVNSITLSPQAIDLNVKVILLGSRDLYYMLQDYDDEFAELFRVLVDFDHEIALKNRNLVDFVGRVRHQVLRLGMTGIEEDAMLRLVSYSMRMAEHQLKLSARFSDVIELIHEAHYFGHQQGHSVLQLNHIEQALAAKKMRTGRVSSALLEDIKEGHVLIATEGKAVGKVNGLTVLEVGDTMFGTPARITSTVYAGAAGVVDIEREVELGQPIHSKGVMLLTGYLGNKYAQYFPLTLSANIALEQSYGHIDGDSASLGELIALISALTELPATQELAITGSINQYGEVQAVGGVNEKIEGFFDLCLHRGLTGQQGVVIPASNQINLMLNSAVIKAIREKRFHVYVVATVDEAISLLMGMDAGQINTKGRYPKGSVNYHAVNRLYNIANIVSGAD